MSYKKFSSLRDRFKSDLDSKLRAGWESGDLRDPGCNCSHALLRDGTCIFGGKCRASGVVYKIRCRLCQQQYIGSTGMKLKDRIGQHCNIAQASHNGRHKEKSTFQTHFCNHLNVLFPDGEKVRGATVRNMLEVEVLWEGNPLTMNRMFGTRSCRLCLEEKVEILKHLDKDPGMMVNTSIELMRGCRHTAKLHRFVRSTEPGH